MTDRKSSHGISTFTGTIDELLVHTLTINVDELDANIEEQKLINQIKEMFGVDDTEARQMIKDAMAQCIQKELNEMVDDGTVEIVGYDENNEPLYGLKDKNKKKKTK
jgi:hypothetical protein